MPHSTSLHPAAHFHRAGSPSRRARGAAFIVPAALLAFLTRPVFAQTVPSPREVIGFEVGADRSLADWPTITKYFAMLATASAAVRVDTLGPTTLGKPFIAVTISTPENMRRLDEIRANQALLADPRKLDAATERRLIATQPAVILISCNIHSTEIASSQMAMELAWRLATVDTLQAQLKHVVVLLIPSMNPDGEQMVVDWYRQGLGTKFEGGPMPWLYHPYVGHDDNRDWYMVTQKETRLVTDFLYRRWFPEVFYDVHQMGSQGARLFVPPFVDPIDPNVDPLIVSGIAQVGAEMGMALASAGKSGVVDHAVYDLWWHGGARSTPTRHNIIGLLTEAASVKIATPITQTAADLTGHDRGLPVYKREMNFPDPWPGGEWHLRDIVDYEEIAARALVKLGSDQREMYVRDFVNLGHKEIAAGQTEAPFAIPDEQWDAGAAAKLADVLRVGGVEVERVDSGLWSEGRRYAGGYLIRLDQPYRAHVKDLLEPQDYPKLERWPGGPIERPYDVAGWTLPFQMGVRTIRVDSLTAPSPVAAPRCVAQRGAHPALDARDVRSYADVFRALGAGVPVRLVPTPARDANAALLPGGAFVLMRTPPARLGLAGRSCASLPPVRAVPNGPTLTRAPRVGLYRPWTANMDEGWTRWLFEQFGVPYTSLTDSAVQTGGRALRDQFDVIVVPDMSLREARSGMSATAVPARYAGGLGAAGLEALRTFADSGGTLVLFDRASELATAVFGVSVTRITVAARSTDRPDARAAGPGGEELYAPGSVFRVLVDTRHPVSRGLPDTAAVYFTDSVTFDVPAGSGVQVIARYPDRAEDVLMSGYLQGGATIAGKAAAIQAPLGKGRVIMFGFRPQYRGQSYGTFGMLFNALLESGTPAPTR